MNTNNIDSSLRINDILSFITLYNTIGIGGGTHSIEELQHSDCILVVRTNLYSIKIASMVKRAVEKGAKLIIVNPKEIELSRLSSLHLRIYPGTDAVLFMEMANVIIEEGMFEKNFIEKSCNGFDEFRSMILDFPLRKVERLTGVPQELIREEQVCLGSLRRNGA